MGIRVAVVGSGFMGKTHGEAIYKGGLDAEVGYVVSRRLERAEALAAALPGDVVATTELDVALNDPTIAVVDICTPTPTHGELVARAAAAGKHVICEKPIALSLAETDAMIRCCEEAGVALMVAHVLRFWPEYVAVAEMVASGRLGALRQVSCTRLSAAPAWVDGGPNWFADLSQSGGAVVDLAIHDFDFVNWVGGPARVTKAVGDARQFGCVMELAGGATAQVSSSTVMPPGWEFEMGFRLDGERGSVVFDGKKGGELRVFGEGDPETVRVEGSRTFKQNVGEGEELDGYFYQLAYFLGCVRDGKRPERGTPAQARAALAMALGVQAALDE